MDTLKGFSTLEILIAMVIAVMTMSAIILVSFGGQSTVLAGETNAEAVTKAQALVEATQALARQDFNLANPVATTTDGIYQKSVTVELQPDYLTKIVTAFVKWTGDHGQELYTKLTTIVTNLENVNAPNSCGSALIGDWNNPQITSPIDVGNTSSGNPVQDVDVSNKKLYIVTDNSHGNNEDFYIYDAAADPLNPTYVSSLKTVTAHAGLNAVVVATAGSNKYAYVASAYDPNFKTCTPGPNCSQLQVIDVTTAAIPAVIKNYLVPTSTAPFVLGNMSGSNQAVGKSIFYKDGIIYLGLSIAASGPEFIVIDVGGGGTGGTPAAPKYMGSYDVNATVNSIIVKGNYAYLTTTDQSNDLTILNVTTPASPTFASRYNSAGIGYGKGEYLVGSTFYFGSTYAGDATPELYFLDVTDPLVTPTLIASKNIGTAASPESVNGVLVRDYLEFLVTNKYFQVWNITNPLSMSLIKQFDLTAQVGPGSAGLATDCEGNYIYIGSYRVNNDKGVILVVYPGVPLDYSLSNSGDISVAQGGSGSTNLTRTLVSGTPSSVTVAVTGLPAGATASYTNNPCTTSCTSAITITTGAATPVGTYPITVTGSPNGTSNPTTTFNLVVGAPFDYTLTNSGNITVSKGNNGSTVVTRTLVSGATTAVNISSVTGLPAHTSVQSITNNPCGPTCASTLTIHTQNSATPGSYPITVTGSPAGAGPRTTLFTLIITP